MPNKLRDSVTGAKLSLLLIAEDAAVASLVRQALAGLPEPAAWTIHEIAWEQGAVTLASAEYALALVAGTLDSPAALELLRQAQLRTTGPVLLVGVFDPVAASAVGAADLVTPDELTPALLGRVLRYQLQRRQLEERIARLGQFDSLTGLPNRFLLHDRLAQLLARAGRDATQVGVMLLGIDRFKGVTESLGHRVGDQLLQAVARRLSDSIRECDTVARLDGDEFVLLFSGLRNHRQAAAIAARILVAFARPSQVEDREIYLSPSIGIAIYPLDGSEGEVLMGCAETALSMARSNGGNCYQFFAPEMNAAARERLELETGLHRALERDEFLLHYQPQFDLASGALIGFEALLRWQSPTHGLVMPRRFIPLLEENGLICSVGEWVLRSACRQLRRWQEAGLRPGRLAVNLSGRQLRVPGLVELFLGILRETGVDPAQLDIELTEGHVMQRLQLNVEVLRRLTDQGVQLVMDDFGIEDSSLSCLKHLPVNKVKIAHSFTSQIGRSAEDDALIRAILAMSHSLGLKVIGEGIESREQFDFLCAQGCEEGLGDWFAPARSAAEIEQMLRRH